MFQAPLLLRGGGLDGLVLEDAQSLDQVLKGAPARLVMRYRDPADVTERIRRLLRHHLAGKLPSLQAVGETLAVAPQT